MPEYKIREATPDDAGYIARAIIAAEKSGSDVLSYATVFNITEDEVYDLIINILNEEIDGCEFSISSYLIAEIDNTVAGTAGAWVENKKEPSSFIKSNMLSYFLPESSIAYASKEAKITSELVIDHVEGALSIVIAYVSPEHRGQNLFRLLTDAHLKRNPGVKELSLQVMANNIPAIRSYEKYGFSVTLSKKTDDPRIFKFLPYNEKLLMSKKV
jgi:ribosomal protein S18 acetylase RimI-like enzyme